MTKHLCPICSSKDNSITNNHIFSFIKCKNCFHETILIKEENISKFVNKSLKNNNIKPQISPQIEDVVEYSYCPYWTIMKAFKQLSKIRIRKRTQNLLMVQTFSDKSVGIFANNLKIPYNISETDDFYYINIQALPSSP